MVGFELQYTKNAYESSLKYYEERTERSQGSYIIGEELGWFAAAPFD